MQLKIFTAFSIVILFGACNFTDDNDVSDRSGSTATNTISDTVYLERNTVITPANSYSDLFLDSMNINRFMAKENLTEQEMQRINSFYNYRNLQYAWFTSQGPTEQARGFWNLQNKLGSKNGKFLSNKMDTLLNSDSLVSRFDSSILHTELALTKAYLDFFNVHRSKTHFANLSPEKAIPIMRMNTMELADSLLRQTNDSSGISPTDQYSLLKQKLQLYLDMAKKGDGQPLNIKAGQLKKGTTSPLVIALKKKLQQSGDMAGTDTTAMYNDSLVMAIKNYQSQHGMEPTGNINDSLITELNVPSKQRLQQLIINLYRARWMPVNDEANYLMANIPNFLLTVYENNKKVFDMPVAVGKEGTKTTIFTDELNQIVFSPYWNIPASIVKNEIMPKMKANPNYLKSQNMEIVSQNDSIPTIRQLPGKGNAMGKAKFLFPNRYDIYLHDTYNESIFNQKNRAISHGCIRLKNAEKLAKYLLRNDKNWTPEKIHAAMETADKEQYAKVSPAVPVRITYYTAWVDETGRLKYAMDIYNHDDEVAQMLFDDRVPGNGIPGSKADSARIVGR